MSLLLVGIPAGISPHLVGRLRAQDDEVRALLPEERAAEGWRALGAFVAVGPLDDADLVERAAQNVRTLVVGPDWEPKIAEVFVALIEGVRKAGVERIVLWGPKLDASFAEEIRLSGLSYVLLRGGKRRWLGSATLSGDRWSEAIDAADDLAGNVRLDLDLTTAAGWESLRLEPPL